MTYDGNNKRDPDYHLKEKPAEKRKPLTFEQLFVMMTAAVEKVEDYRFFWNDEGGVMSIDKDSYYEFINHKRKEIEHFMKALKAGPIAMRNYILTERRNVSDRIRNAVHKADMKSYAELQAAKLTGNAEFDEFRARVDRHDYYYSYSDDGGVYRRGADDRNAIEAIVKEKGGMFKDYWMHVVKGYNEAQARSEEIHRAKREAEGKK